MMKLFLAMAATILFTISSTPSASSFPEPPPFINPWDFFQNLTGCRHGDSLPGLDSLKQYLRQFGYIPVDPISAAANFTDVFDDTLESALRAYQRNFRLDVTGFLDQPTVETLMSPRCGVPDIINGTSSMDSGANSTSTPLHGRNLFTYFPGNPTWPPDQRSLTYAFTSTSAVSIDPTALRAVFSRAFSRWSAATSLSFTETDSSNNPDITIGFYNGDHGDGEPFDGVLGILAHSFSPTNGRFHLDAAEQWVAEGDVTAATSNVAVDLESVAVHEIGHLLGLGHSSVEQAVMYPTIKSRTRKVELSGDDVAGVQRLYGGNPNYKGAPLAATTSQGRDTNDGGNPLAFGWSRRASSFSLAVGVALLIFF